MNHEQIKIWAIIPAAGTGKRMNSSTPKQYLKLDDKTVLEHSMSKLLECDLIAGVAVGIAGNDENWQNLTIDHHRFLGGYTGGAERIHTVMNGLKFLNKWANSDDWILVHDAVRPCVSARDIENLIQKGLNSEHGAILAARVIDTVKKINSENNIEQTINRNELALAMTPQFFPIQILRKALNQALDQGRVSTDDSATVENIGLNPLIIEGKRSNIKITMPEDLELAKLYKKLLR